MDVRQQAQDGKGVVSTHQERQESADSSEEDPEKKEFLLKECLYLSSGEGGVPPKKNSY